MTVSPNSTMLPPIWVAACDSHRRRNAGIAEDGERAFGAGVPRSRRSRSTSTGTLASVTKVGRAASVVAGASPTTAAVIAGSPRSTNAASRRSSVARSIRTWRSHVRQRRPMSAPSRSTSQVSPPHGCVRRRRTTSPSSRSRTGRSGTAGRVSEPWTAVTRDEVTVRGRDADAVHGRDLDDHVRLRRGELGDDPARSRQGPGELVRRADRGARTDRRAGTVDRDGSPGDPTVTTPGTSRTLSIAIASAPGVAQLVDEVLDARTVDRTADDDRDAGPGRRIDPGVQPDPPQVGAQLVDRHVAALGVLLSVDELALQVATSPRSWSLRSLRLATSTVRSCDDSPANAAPLAWVRSWTTTSSPSTKATAAIVSWFRAGIVTAASPVAPVDGWGRA